MESQDISSRPNCFCGSKFSGENTQEPAVPEQIARSTPEIKNNIINLINNLDNARPIIPETINILCGRLNDEEKDVALHAAKKIHQYSLETARNAIISNTRMMAALVQAISTRTDPEIAAEVVSTFHQLSHHSDGLLAIYTNNAIPSLVQQLASPIDSIVIDALTTLYNLLWYRADSDRAFCSAGGVEQLLQLLQGNNVQLMVFTIYCLGMMANECPGNQEKIIATGGLTELLRILRSHEDEELVDQTVDVLLMFTLNPYNREAIISVGGTQALIASMLSNGDRLNFTTRCLWMLQKWSGEIGFASAMSNDEFDHLLCMLVALLSASDDVLVKFAISIMNNLTGHGSHYRQLLCQTHVVQALVSSIINIGTDREDISTMTVQILSNLAVHVADETAQDIARPTHYAIRHVVQLLVSATSASLVKAVVGLIRNLALSSVNYAPLLSANAMDHMTQLLEKAGIDLVSIICYFS